MSGKILLVDDDKIFREEFKEYFPEYEIIDVKNGTEAIKALKSPNEIDLVILDVMMPDALGTDLLHDIKQLIPHIKVIILTGQGSKDILIKSLRGRADDYIEKPLNAEEVKEIIEKVFELRPEMNGGDEKDTDGKLQRVKRFVQRNCQKKLRLRDAAQLVCLSPKYLSRIFKENTGMGFNEYRLSLMIDKAKLFLSNTGFNINELSYKMGYANAESFTRQFNKIVGMTPKEYRIKVRRTMKQSGKNSYPSNPRVNNGRRRPKLKVQYS